MSKDTAFILVAIILAITFPLIPKLIQLRVWFLRKLRMTSIASIVERHALAFANILRVVWVAVIATLLYLVLS